jgi:hypothetical protein
MTGTLFFRAPFFFVDGAQPVLLVGSLHARVDPGAPLAAKQNI